MPPGSGSDDRFTVHPRHAWILSATGGGS
jgi:hypothetical protein